MQHVQRVANVVAQVPNDAAVGGFRLPQQRLRHGVGFAGPQQQHEQVPQNDGHDRHDDERNDQRFATGGQVVLLKPLTAVDGHSPRQIAAKHDGGASAQMRRNAALAAGIVSKLYTCVVGDGHPEFQRVWHHRPDVGFNLK